MTGWILVACCAGLVGIGLYLMWTIPDTDTSLGFLDPCPGDCDRCGQDG